MTVSTPWTAISRRSTPAQDLAQGVEVEHVGQALAVRLDEDREAAVARRDLEQVGGALALLPERRARPGPASRQQQRPPRVLAEARREQRRAPARLDDQVLDLVGVGKSSASISASGGVALGQADRDPVVRPDRLHLDAEALAEPRLDGQRPRRVDAAAERAEDHEPPVAELVAEALDDEPPVGRQGARDLALLLDVRDEVVRRVLVEVVALAEPRRERAVGRARPRASSASASRRNAPIARPSSTGRPTASPFQNGSLPGTPGAGSTITRSGVMSSTRQLLAPRTTTSPCIPARSS